MKARFELHSQFILQRLFFLLIVYSLIRIAYTTYNWHLIFDEGLGSIFFGWWIGVLYDLQALVFLNTLFFAFWCLPVEWQKTRLWRYTVEAAFIFTNTLFIALNLVDVELINFNARRLTPVFFSLKQDVGGQLPQLIAYYWWIALAALALGFSVGYFVPKISQIQQVWPKRISLWLLVGVLLAGYWPLNQSLAFRGPVDVGHMALNTTFTFLKTPVRPQRPYIFFSNEEVKQILKQDQGAMDVPKGVPRPKNVVIIILESFALEYMGRVNGRSGYTPFLDELSERSLFFKNGFSNGKRSIEVMPSVLAQFPSLLEEPFLQSTSQHISLVGLPYFVKDLGYSTHFFHGAHNGSMFFDVFAERLGFDQYHGLNEYPVQDGDLDGSWGVLDEPYLQHFAKTLSEVKAPFVATLFTLSSHQPYPVPAHLKENFPDGTLAIHESIGYTDFALKRFFEAAQEKPWYKDTLFVITADHTQLSDDESFKNLLGRYRVPILFFQDGQTWPEINRDQIVQHADIMPSVLDLLNIDVSQLNHVGASVWRREGPGFVVNRDPKGFWFFNGSCLIWILEDGTTQLEKGNLSCNEEPLRFFKAYIQNFTTRVALDQWMGPLK